MRSPGTASNQALVSASFELMECEGKLSVFVKLWSVIYISLFSDRFDPRRSLDALSHSVIDQIPRILADPVVMLRPKPHCVGIVGSDKTPLDRPRQSGSQRRQRLDLVLLT